MLLCTMYLAGESSRSASPPLYTEADLKAMTNEKLKVRLGSRRKSSAKLSCILPNVCRGVLRGPSVRTLLVSKNVYKLGVIPKVV